MLQPCWPSFFGGSILVVQRLTVERARFPDNERTAAAASVRCIPLTTWCSLSKTFPRLSSNLSIQPVLTTITPIKTAAATLVPLPLHHTKCVTCSPNDFETFMPSNFSLFICTAEMSLGTWIVEIRGSVILYSWYHTTKCKWAGETNFPSLSAMSTKAMMSRNVRFALSEFLKAWVGILKTTWKLLRRIYRVMVPQTPSDNLFLQSSKHLVFWQREVAYPAASSRKCYKGRPMC